MEIDTSPMGRTTVSVSDEVADELHEMKQRGESYDDVLRRMLGLDDSDTAETGREGGPQAHIETSTGTPDVDRDALRDALAGSGDVLEARVDAIVSMYEYLREHGSAEKRELLDAIDVTATGYDSAESVWSNMVKGRDSLRALPGVEPPSSGMSTWRYTDE